MLEGGLPSQLPGYQAGIHPHSHGLEQPRGHRKMLTHGTRALNAVDESSATELG